MSFLGASIKLADRLILPLSVGVTTFGGFLLYKEIVSNNLLNPELITALPSALAASIGAATILYAAYKLLRSDTITLSRDNLQVQIVRLEQEISALRFDSSAVRLNPAERKLFIEKLTKRINDELVTDAIKAELQKLVSAHQELNTRDPFAIRSEQASARITQQIAALGGRANLNLLIGLFLAILGVFFLIFYVQTSLSQPADLTQFVIQFLPRLSLVTIIELFSYFFLRLYKQAIDEIKFFQNELTNIDSKMLAASITQNLCPDKPEIVLNALASTERNFLVPNGQRVVFEPHDAEIQTATQKILDALTSLRKEK